MNVFIVDDHPLVRRGLMALLESCPGFTVAGEEGAAARAVEQILARRPDLALVDLRLGDGDGLDVLQRCRERGSACRFIIITSSVSRGDFQRALEAGVDGYVLKDALPEELLYAVRLVAQGRRYYDPAMVGSAWEESQELGRLTTREREVLSSLGRGSKNSEIARELYITEFTVKKYVSQILDKLSLKDRTQAALYAVHNGLVRERGVGV